MQYDQLQTLYRTLLVFATVAVVILAVGLVEFVYFEPPGQATGVKARIAGVYQYDPATGSYVGPDGKTYTQANLAHDASEGQTWQDMVLPPK